MFNRLHNCANPYQTKAKRVLCVCSAGLLRSPTAANVLHKEYGYNTRACGVDADHALVPIDHVLIKWADEIVCMDKYQAEAIQTMVDLQMYPAPTIRILDIPDRYEWMDEELQSLLLKSYRDSVHIQGKTNE